MDDVPRSTWMPASPCGLGCLPSSATSIGSVLRVAARLAAVVSVLLVAVVGALLPGPWARRWLRWCCRGMLRAIGVRLKAVGVTPAGETGLFVANHRSWVDVLALATVTRGRLLAKQEVAAWPIVGVLARRVGTLFVDRARLRALPAGVGAVTAVLRAGDDVVVFPEGTTWCGAAAGPFRRAAFQAALDAAVPVRPVAVRFRLDDGAATLAPAFVGDQTLLDSLIRVLRTRHVTCEVTVLPPLLPIGDRRALARRAQEAIATVTGVHHRAAPRPQLGEAATSPAAPAGIRRPAGTRSATSGAVR